MQHQQATRHLSDLLTGDLTGDRQAELSEHLETCEECQDWSETYTFLSQALQADHDTEHPSSEQIAHLAVDAELLTTPERERLGRHLEECADCRHEIESTRQALAGARQEPTLHRFPVRLPQRAMTLRLALAASLILALAVTFVTMRPEATDGGRSVTAAAADGGRLIPAADRQLSGDRLGGSRVIEAPRVLTANAVVIESGSEITLRAGEMVVLGDGFSIGSSSTLGVENVPRTNDDLDSEST